MSPIKHILPGLVLAAGMLLPGPVLADRPPTPQEQSRIETMLRNEGFTRWGHIELDEDDDVWEIAGAYASDGRKYDLWLHPDTLAIIGREPMTTDVAPFGCCGYNSFRSVAEQRSCSEQLPFLDQRPAMRYRELLKPPCAVIPERYQGGRRAAVGPLTETGRARRSIRLHEDQSLRHEA